MLMVSGAIILRGRWKGVDVYGAFLEGARNGAVSAFSLLPALCAMLMMLRLMQHSGLMDMLVGLLMPLLTPLNIPKEAVGMVLIRPFTGTGSLAMMEEVFRQCGVDSRAGRLAAVLMGSSETIFYTLTVYLGATSVRKLPWVVPVSLASYAASVAVASILVV